MNIQYKKMGGNLGIFVEGEYHRMGNGYGPYWVLVAWRITSPSHHGWSEWYKIHRNRKKPLGPLALRIDGPNL